MTLQLMPASGFGDLSAVKSVLASSRASSRQSHGEVDRLIITHSSSGSDLDSKAAEAQRSDFRPSSVPVQHQQHANSSSALRARTQSGENDASSISSNSLRDRVRAIRNYVNSIQDIGITDEFGGEFSDPGDVSLDRSSFRSLQQASSSFDASIPSLDFDPLTQDLDLSGSEHVVFEHELGDNSSSSFGTPSFHLQQTVEEMEQQMQLSQVDNSGLTGASSASIDALLNCFDPATGIVCNRLSPIDETNDTFSTETESKKSSTQTPVASVASVSQSAQTDAPKCKEVCFANATAQTQLQGRRAQRAVELASVEHVSASVSATPSLISIGTQSDDPEVQAQECNVETSEFACQAQFEAATSSSSAQTDAEPVKEVEVFSRETQTLAESELFVAVPQTVDDWAGLLHQLADASVRFSDDRILQLLIARTCFLRSLSTDACDRTPQGST